MDTSAELLINIIAKLDEKESQPRTSLAWGSQAWNKMLEGYRTGHAEAYKKKHGDKPVMLTIPSYKCPQKKCDGSGWIETVYPPRGYKDDYPYPAEVVSKCICNGGREASEFRRIHSMIPFEYLNKCGRDFKWSLYSEDISRQKSIINSFILKFDEFNKQGKGLYIYSSVKGSGKTMLSCCIANELSGKGISIKFINVLDLAELSRRSFKDESHRDEVDSLFDASLLVIDDLGCEQGTEWFNSMFLRLVNTRHGKKRITIYTSNISPEKLKLDDRISSRIQESSINVKLPDESIRSRLAKYNNDEFLKSLMEVN